MWGLAVVGGLQELWPKNEARVLSIVIYVLMGWAALVALLPLWNALGAAGFVWVAGGLFYTVGIVFYVIDDRLGLGQASGTCSCSQAASATTSPSFATSCGRAEPGTDRGAVRVPDPPGRYDGPRLMRGEPR